MTAQCGWAQAACSASAQSVACLQQLQGAKGMWQTTGGWGVAHLASKGRLGVQQAGWQAAALGARWHCTQHTSSPNITVCIQHVDLQQVPVFAVLCDQQQLAQCVHQAEAFFFGRLGLIVLIICLHPCAGRQQQQQH
jgi:hypothetical protein